MPSSPYLLGLWHDELSEVGGDGLELPVEQVLLELAVSAGAGERGHLGGRFTSDVRSEYH